MNAHRVSAGDRLRHADQLSLEQRVTLDSRRGKKIGSVIDLHVALLKYGTADTILETALTIDKSDLEPMVVAERIAAFFELGLSPTLTP